MFVINVIVIIINYYDNRVRKLNEKINNSKENEDRMEDSVYIYTQSDSPIYNDNQFRVTWREINGKVEAILLRRV